MFNEILSYALLVVLGAIIVAFAPDYVEGTVELDIYLAPVIERDLGRRHRPPTR